MKKILLSLSFITCMGSLAFAQIENPVKWNFSAKKISATEYELHLTATLDKTWHMYAQDAGEGPEPTSIAFTANPLLKYNGKVKEVGKLTKEFDTNFNSVLKFYGDKVDFVQKVTVKAGVPTVAKGNITYMVCNNNKCLPPKAIPFSIKIGGK